MEINSRSPKRVRILASINPLISEATTIARKLARSDPETAASAPIAQPPSSPRGTGTVQPSTAGEKSQGDISPSLEPKRSKFRFKSHRSNSRRHHRSGGGGGGGGGDDDGAHGSSSQHRQHRHHHRHHRSRRKPRSSGSPGVEKPKEEGEAEAPDPYEPPPLDPDTAFRESLFDAMADDEGAAYWEAVYGQPIHVYVDARGQQPGSSGDTSTAGLEHMTDEEYAAYVRQKMWEKTHAGLLEARERARHEKEDRATREAEQARIRAEVERSLRRGEERRQRRTWQDRWREYADAWAAWDVDKAPPGSGDENTATSEQEQHLRIPWPVMSGDRRDVLGRDDNSNSNGGGGDNVRFFFVRGLDLEGLGEREFAARLRDERIRWHPDKMQQRLGGHVDAGLMRDITAVFQIIDKLWAETRGPRQV